MYRNLSVPRLLRFAKFSTLPLGQIPRALRLLSAKYFRFIDSRYEIESIPAFPALPVRSMVHPTHFRLLSTYRYSQSQT